MSVASRRLFFGILLLVLGVVILLINLRLMPLSWQAIWPLAVAALGLWLMAESSRRPGARGLVAGIVAFAIGIFWFVERLGWIQQELFLGVLFMAFGLGLLAQSMARTRS